jgi:phospholipid-binding lipoprotein MlaA|tara:strand:- start:7532 stop:8227 length:696 start_codon:yes stop_codon:yes gene_type:complete
MSLFLRSFSIVIGFHLLILGNVQAAESDPFEGVNRKVFALNEYLDKWLVKPAAKVYRWSTPDFVDQGITNVFYNLGEIRNGVNSLLQADPSNAGKSTARLLVNSTVGVLGFFDVASRWNIQSEKEDFGQTLAVWGVADGPYVVLPMLGGRSLRDAVAFAPDVYLSPLEKIDYVATRNTVRAIDLIDIRADLIDAEQMVSGDRYGFLRDIYQQRRAAAIANGDIADDFDDDF